MSIQRVDLSDEPQVLPRHLQILLDETAEDLMDWQNAAEATRFVPADYVLLYDALCELRPLMPKEEQPAFMEWGSGLGIVTLLAAAMGWRATGIEIHPGLLRQSMQYARAFDLPATFLQGSFFPDDREVVEDLEQRMARTHLLYVYPWPDQEIEIFDLFDRLATPGTYLLTYYGIEDVRAFRKQ
jgi:hypothetical protein